MSAYTDRIEEEAKKAYDLAEAAREQGKDPEKRVDIPIAEDLPEKAEGLVTADQFPELEGTGVKERIRELEEEYGKNDDRVALVIGKEIAQHEYYEFADREKAIEAGLRIGLAYMTGGIVTAPLEGVADVSIRTNNDGSEYLAVFYSGPIRSAGGTASAMSVLLADYIRKEVGLDRYKPTDTELDRYAVEVEDYYTRVTKKQYTPTREETRMIAEHVPVEVTGTPTENIEVSSHKDLARIETNRIRGGMCLIYLDGLPLKASKIKRRIQDYGDTFGLQHWDWIEEYLELQHEIHASGGEEDEEAEKSYEPNDKFLGNIVAGRPVFSHPGKRGGFRLRYGRSRTGGLAAVSFHPATLAVLDDFMAIGTQLKTEYPGKATVVTPCDRIEPPLVRLDDGTVTRVETRDEARELDDRIDEVLFVGDILVPYGEFLENGKDLLPSPYVREWWARDVEAALKETDLDMDISSYLTPPYDPPNVRTALTIARRLDVPLHPAHTFHWEQLSTERTEPLHAAVREAEDGRLPREDGVKEALEELHVEHTVEEDAIRVGEEVHTAFTELLKPGETEPDDFERGVREAIEEVSGITVRPQAPIYLGTRMGRPEKAERRTLKGRPQLLFPSGREEGGRMRNLSETYKKGSVQSEAIAYHCPECDELVPYSSCPFCGTDTEERRRCRECGSIIPDEEHCGRPTARSWNRRIDVKGLYRNAMDTLGIREAPQMLKAPYGVTGRHSHVEPIEKGLLRQRHDLYVNKDGTIRYDASDLPMTHFRPAEIGVSVERLRELGYEEDVEGEPLTDSDQMVELKYQDIIIPDFEGDAVSAVDYMSRAARFVDDLLEEVYGLERYYDIEEKDDLIGELVVGLAPHTSGGVVGRIIGFTDAKGIYAHPFWHAAKRRNCDGDEDSIILLMDALLNFSRQFLPDQRGTRTMDAPLILSTVLHPDEVDDESWNVDVPGAYPKRFYEATQRMAGPKEVDIPIAEDILDEDAGFGYTHDTTTIRDGPTISSYVSLGDIPEKVEAQLSLGERVKAVEVNEVAERLLQSHFIPDIKGNLRAFSQQKMICSHCDEKFRRIPLKGRCRACGQSLKLTVPEGGVRKYLMHCEEIADRFAISPYLRQHIRILKENIQSLFGKDQRQSDLSRFAAD